MRYKKILDNCVPTKQDEQALKQVISSILSKIKVQGATVMVGGSGGKNTWLKNTHDIDIYVKFNYEKYKEKSEQLSDFLHKALKKSFKKIDLLHGSRDYFQIHHKGFTFEIVPILNIANYVQAKNTTDLSQLHVNYVKRYPKLASDIRLAKVFAKAQNIYGAESYQRGFSGYCLEVLTIKYGSFTKLLRAVAKWKATETIGSKRLAARLNAAKKVSPLILIDPVQPDRNVAAALSREKYDRFRKATKQFIRKPSLKFFEKKPFDMKQLAKKGKLIFLSVAPLQGKKDISGAKMLKAFSFLKRQLQRHGFTLVKAGWEFDPAALSYIYFVTPSKPLSREVKHLGPPIAATDACKSFRKKHRKVVMQGKRLCALIPRHFQAAESCIDALLQEKNVKKRVKSAKIQAIVEAKRL